jgi:hypothetical protein
LGGGLRRLNVPCEETERQREERGKERREAKRGERQREERGKERKKKHDRNGIRTHARED